MKLTGEQRKEVMAAWREDERRKFTEKIVQQQNERYTLFREDETCVPPLVRFIDEGKDDQERFERAYCVALYAGSAAAHGPPDGGRMSASVSVRMVPHDGGVRFWVRSGRKQIAKGWARTVRDAFEGCARAIDYETGGSPKPIGPPIAARVVQSEKPLSYHRPEARSEADRVILRMYVFGGVMLLGSGALGYALWRKR